MFKLKNKEYYSLVRDLKGNGFEVDYLLNKYEDFKTTVEAYDVFYRLRGKKL